MSAKRRWSLLGLLSILALTAAWLHAQPAKPTDRAGLMKAHAAGNYRDAYDGLSKMALDPKDDAGKVVSDLETSIDCLTRLGRVDEIDDFREGVIKAHGTNWRLLQSAARSYFQGNHYGFIVAGKFERGNKRGGGRWVNAMPRDRGRALQLMEQALEHTKKETDKPALANFHLYFASMLLDHNGYYNAWRLQYRTVIAQLPDYEDGNYWYQDGRGRGAPVDADGKPVFHLRPKGYDNAQSDGERWRWMLSQAIEFDPSRRNEVQMIWANFLHAQFGVQTMAHYGFRNNPDPKENKTGTFALHTLNDGETIARLATGFKRFPLGEDFNFIKMYEQVAGRGKSQFGEQARDTLASIYENRRQYPKAAEAWKTAIAEYGVGQNGHRQQRLDEIIGNWGRFEPIAVFPAGTKATVNFRFRNGDKVSFEAFTVRMDKLLDDVKGYLKNSPNQIDWNAIQIGNIGHRLVELQQQQYLGPKVAGWDMNLKPRPKHVDERVTVTTPLTKPGYYLVNAKMANGNTSRIIVNISDTAIVKKQLDNQVLYYVADAVTSQPVAKAEVDFFGWRQVQVVPGKNQWRVETQQFNATTDAAGQLILGQDKLPQNFQWLLTARKAKAGADGSDRFTHMGFNYHNFNRQYDPEYNQTRTFLITDRPVYRPDHKVEFKFWVRHSKYDQADTSDFANLPFTVQINNPRGEKVFDKVITTDEFGGAVGEFPLARDAMLGVYSLNVIHPKDVPAAAPAPAPGRRFVRRRVVPNVGTFRVEEYKKPEFEVTVEAPKEPVQLGEKIDATVKAKYYFGAPVTSAKVKYKVLRSSCTSNWYPHGSWDWLYGRGYWWFAADYPWYPGFGEWGCMRPYPWWFGARFQQPEVVIENEVPVGPDGTVSIPIDTLAAKELHGDEDHKYTITAEVTDESRRTIVGSGDVLVARQPFKVFTWLDRGHYRIGDTIRASFAAHTLAQKPVQGTGELTLYRINYDEKNEPVEKKVQSWKLDTNVEGLANQQLKASIAGQYRLAYRVTDAKKHTIEGAYLFVIRGDGFSGRDYRFNDLELVTDKREYAPGDKIKLMINTNKPGAVVLLFLRPTNSIYLPPKVIRLAGKSTVEEIGVVQRDMPNLFIEALTVSNGKVYTETREVVVPPENRILNVEVLPSQTEYKPGQKATVKVKVTDFFGNPFLGSTVLSIYDKSVEYISGGGNVPEIRDFFWKWRRHHNPHTESTLAASFWNLLRRGETGMSNLGVFGDLVVEELRAAQGQMKGRSGALRERGARAMDGFGMMGGAGGAPGAPMAANMAKAEGKDADRAEQQQLQAADKRAGDPAAPPAPPGVEPTVRKNFADTALWVGSLATNKDGIAEVSLNMPENLTTWKVKVWGMGHGTKVGQGEADVITKKYLLVRLQAPRFFVQKDEVVLSANVHNYLKSEKTVTVSLEMAGNTLVPMESNLVQRVQIAANSEKRIDWRVKVISEGQAVVRMKAITDEESDAMEMRFPCYVHGMLKTDSYSAVVRPEKSEASVTFSVPAERRVNESRLEVRYSPTLAGAMVDALPYLVDYPYGCTEQTLNRFLPTVVTQRTLQRMNVDLKAIRDKRTNLNAQEIGDDKERAKGWKRYDRNPVFDEAEVKKMVNAGIERLQGMQLSDGGWGWFSGWGEHSWPHTTAVVVHGLQIAKDNDVKLPQGMLERGVAWLKNYQAEQVRRIKNAPAKIFPWKPYADNLDAFVYMVLADANIADNDMREFLYRDRTHIAVYAKAMYGLALHKQKQADKLAMILKNIDQFLIVDNENQTTYLKLPAHNYWWNWYGSETEANGYYLKLLSKTNARDEKAAGLVKYLLNNRKHATYWNNTRDTAVCVEAMAEYIRASGEDKPNMMVEVWLDGKKKQEVKIDSSNLFDFNNKFVLTGDAVETGKHVLEIKRKGVGPVYFNAYLTNFTLEDFITKAGLEVRVNRKYYKLTSVDKKIKVSGARGQALDQKVEKYQRTQLSNLAELKSGELVEVELEIDSKNDYEYLCFEDPKAAGFEPMLVRSGYNANDMGAFMELRDDRVCFFVRVLARGKHSLSYRLRAEIPGKFSALPTRGYAMYAPELKGNSDEIKLQIKD